MNYIESITPHKSNQNILVFEIDDAFLKGQGLMDKDNLINGKYNDFLPREYLIDFINKMDIVKPKLLFIDMDLSKSKQPLIEKELLKLLNKERCYTIYFTHNGNENFIEKKNIANTKFVSTLLAANGSNNRIRRYESFLERKNESGKSEKYYYAPLLFSGADISEIKSAYNVVNNRFIYKDRYVDSFSEKSYWENIRFFFI